MLPQIKETEHRSQIVLFHLFDLPEGQDLGYSDSPLPKTILVFSQVLYGITYYLCNDIFQAEATAKECGGGMSSVPALFPASR